MFEHRSEPLLHRLAFIRRMVFSVLVGLVLIGGSLLVGMWGYHDLEKLSWIDAFLNASMILSGMGPIWQPQTTAGKLFAGVYALYSGLAVILVAGITFAPLVHRLYHRFHLDLNDRDE